jgi:hypothetical protein
MAAMSTAAVVGHVYHSKAACQFAHAKHSTMCQWQQEYLQKKAECFRTQQTQTGKGQLNGQELRHSIKLMR